MMGDPILTGWRGFVARRCSAAPDGLGCGGGSGRMVGRRLSGGVRRAVLALLALGLLALPLGPLRHAAMAGPSATARHPGFLPGPLAEPCPGHAWAEAAH